MKSIAINAFLYAMPMPALSAAHARLGVRLLALYFFVEGLWQLLANLLTSIHAFDPSYLGFYFRTQALSPVLGMALAVVLLLASGPLGKCLFGKDQG